MRDRSGGPGSTGGDNPGDPQGGGVGTHVPEEALDRDGVCPTVGGGVGEGNGVGLGTGGGWRLEFKPKTGFHSGI